MTLEFQRLLWTSIEIILSNHGRSLVPRVCNLKIQHTEHDGPQKSWVGWVDPIYKFTNPTLKTIKSGELANWIWRISRFGATDILRSKIRKTSVKKMIFCGQTRPRPFQDIILNDRVTVGAIKNLVIFHLISALKWTYFWLITILYLSNKRNNEILKNMEMASFQAFSVKGEFVKKKQSFRSSRSI